MAILQEKQANIWGKQQYLPRTHISWEGESKWRALEAAPDGIAEIVAEREPWSEVEILIPAFCKRLQEM